MQLRRVQNRFITNRRPLTNASEAVCFKLSDILKWLPLIAPLLIFFGVARLSFYYSEFHINIIYFLDFSEIITEFFDFLIINAFTFSAATVLILLEYFTSHIKSKMIITIVNFAIPMSILAAGILVGLNYGNSNYVTVSLVYMVIVVTVLSLKGRMPKDVDKQIKHMLVLIAFGAVLLSLWIVSKFDANDVKQNKKYADVKVYNSGSIITNDSSVYIGNTNNYIFIYNQKSNYTNVYKLSDIKTIQFPHWHNPNSSQYPSTPLPPKPAK